MGITITPLDLGTLIRDKAAFTYKRDAGTRIEVPVIAWLLDVHGTPILVDTGINSPDVTADNHKPLVRTERQELGNALKRHGVAPGDISLVIMTHLHWDHCYNTELFPDARFIVQKSELDYALDPTPKAAKGYDLEPIRATTFETVSGDVPIVGGVSVLLTPGHSPGIQSVLLECEGRRLLIAGDVLPMFENCRAPLLPSGTISSMDDYEASFEKIMKLGVERILPGHDMLVFEKEKYIV